MRVKFFRALALALGLLSAAPLAIAQEGGFGSPSILPEERPGSSYAPRERSSDREEKSYRSVAWQEPQELPPPTPRQDVPIPPPPEPAIGSGLTPPASETLPAPGSAYGSGYGLGIGNLFPGYAQGAEAWNEHCGNGSCGTGACGTSCFDACCTPCACRCGWFGSVGGLVMSKGRDDFNQLSFSDADPTFSPLTTQSSRMETFGGGQFEVGRYLGPNWGVGLTYWGVWGPPATTTVDASSLGGANLNTVFDFQPLNIGATNVNDLYDAAQRHSLTRSYEFNNLEINLFQGGYYSNSGRWGIGLLAGARWFRYREGFAYASSDADLNLNSGLDDVSYNTTTTNDLVGFQIGARANYQPWQRLRLFAAPKFGIYNNYIQLDSTIAGPGGVATVGPGNYYAGQPYDIHSSTNQVAFLGEVGIGADFFITPSWAVTVGYRVVTAAGVAQPFSQIPQNFAGLNDAADINRNDSLVLHGAYAGLSYNY